MEFCPPLRRGVLLRRSKRFLADVATEDGVRCFVEFKSVTWARAPGLGVFPDTRRARARRHVEALRRVCGEGHRAMLLFCVQHMGVERVTTASDVDPDYPAAVRLAHQMGVEVVAFLTLITPDRLLLADALPVIE